MMNLYIDYFINNYIVVNKRDRLIYEINSNKKQSNFIDHFCHDTEKYVINKRIYFYGNKTTVFNKINSDNDEYFVISDSFTEGKMMNKKELQDYFDSEYMAVIAISYSHILIKEEAEYEPYVYMLK